jgi:hypothetical protein
MAINKITFNDLSIGLKTAIVIAWVTGILTMIGFGIGFLVGLIESLA